MANTLVVSADLTYAGSPSDVGTINFTNAFSTHAIATFTTGHFDNVQILDDVLIDGSAGTSAIVISGGSLDGSQWTFNNWIATDSITIIGSAGVDAITGSSAADTITGGLGADTLVGDGGDDIFVYNSDDDIAAGEAVAGGAGTGDALRIGAADSYDFRIMAALGGIERLEFDTPSGGSTARFNSSQFGGGGMSDSLAVTGDGNANSIVVHTLSDTFFSAAGWTFTNWPAGDDAVFIFGTAAAETIIGSSQSNGITGGGGADILTGGGMDDQFNYASGDAVAGESVNGLGGTDTILLNGSSVSHDFSQVTLTSIEKLRLVGTATLNGGQIGSGAITVVDAISSVGVQAVIVNGASVDLSAVTFTAWTAGEDTVTINGTAGNDSLTGSNQRDTLNGGGNQDTLNGGAEADTLNGEAGNDTLNGGAGIDLLKGGLGNDTYVLGAENDTVTDTGGTSDTITSTIGRDISGFAAIENLTLLGAAAVSGIGNGLANVLDGSQNSGGNLLRGLLGDDTYIIGAGDTVDETTGGGGTDTVRALVTHTLAAGVEDLTLIGAAPNGTGNSLANVITGNASANILDGGDGADSLVGGDGKDRLIGGLGPDLFTGGIGGDTFVLAFLEDSGKKKAARDTIHDFTADDFIDLSLIDAKKGGKDNKFKFIKKQGFHDKKGELRFQKKDGDVIISGDVNGDGKADFSILLDNLNKIVKGDFVL